MDGCDHGDCHTYNCQCIGCKSITMCTSEKGRGSLAIDGTLSFSEKGMGSLAIGGTLSFSKVSML